MWIGTILQISLLNTLSTWILFLINSVFKTLFFTITIRGLQLPAWKQNTQNVKYVKNYRRTKSVLKAPGLSANQVLQQKLGRSLSRILRVCRDDRVVWKVVKTILNFSFFIDFEEHISRNISDSKKFSFSPFFFSQKLHGKSNPSIWN